MNFTLILSCLFGYALGCIPAAWILTRVYHGSDITKQGSGNVGTRNVFDVTGSKLLAILTLLADIGKGALAIYLVDLWHNGWFAATAWAGVGLVLGHNFNALLKFKGGRGLAPATGVIAIVNPVPVIVWCMMFLTGYYVIRKNVHVGSLSGTIGATVLIYSLPEKVLAETMMMSQVVVPQFKLMVLVIALLIFVRHIAPIKELIRKESEVDYSDPK